MRLSDNQIAEYHRTGYLVYGDLLSNREVAEYRSLYTSSLDALRAEGTLPNIRPSLDRDGPEEHVYQLRAAHLIDPRFNDLVNHPQILDVAEQLIGPNIRLVLCQGLYKPPHTGGEIAWHQDDFYFGADKPDAVVSCWISFDDATTDNGCMWVQPGMHREILPHTKRASGRGFQVNGVSETTAKPIELKAGQCMFHHGATPHRTLPNTTETHRRAISMHYMDAMVKPLGHNRMIEPAENMPVLRGEGISW